MTNHQTSNISHTLVGNKLAFQRCSNNIFILDLTAGFNGLGKNHCKMGRERFKFLDLVHLY